MPDGLRLYRRLHTGVVCISVCPRLLMSLLDKTFCFFLFFLPLRLCFLINENIKLNYRVSSVAGQYPLRRLRSAHLCSRHHPFLTEISMRDCRIRQFFHLPFCANLGGLPVFSNLRNLLCWENDRIGAVKWPMWRWTSTYCKVNSCVLSIASARLVPVSMCLLKKLIKHIWFN